METLSPIDREALERAIAIDRRRDHATRQQIEDKLESEPWFEVGRFCSFGCQSTALRLKPWQPPPCWAEIADEDNEAGPTCGHRAAAELPAPPSGRWPVALRARSDRCARAARTQR
jgi:hypothetical protein